MLFRTTEEELRLSLIYLLITVPVPIIAFSRRDALGLSEVLENGAKRGRNFACSRSAIERIAFWPLADAAQREISSLNRFLMFLHLIGISTVKYLVS